MSQTPTAIFERIADLAQAIKNSSNFVESRGYAKGIETMARAAAADHETKQTPRQILESREALRDELQMAATMVANLAADYEHGKRIHVSTLIEGLRRCQASYEKALTLAREGDQA